MHTHVSPRVVQFWALLRDRLPDDASMWMKAAGCDDAEELALQLSRSSSSQGRPMQPAVVLAMPWAQETVVPWSARKEAWKHELSELMRIAEMVTGKPFSELIRRKKVDDAEQK